jgi:uncharacterized protein (DUF2141 family)
MAARSQLIGRALLLLLLPVSLCLPLGGREAPAAAQAAKPAPTAKPPQPAKSQATGTLLVQLWDFENDRGQALLALFRSERGFPAKVRYATWSKALPIRNRRVEVTIEQIPAGTVGLAMVHDEDKDFAMDTGLFGIPTEGYGASRDAPAKFGPPKWQDAAFSLRAGERKPIRIRVRY